MDDEQLDFGDDGEEDLHYDGEDVQAEDVDDDNEEGYGADGNGENAPDYDAEDDGLAGLCKYCMPKIRASAACPSCS